MSQGTTFRIIAFDKKNKLSKDEVMKIAVKDRYRLIAWGDKQSEEDTIKHIQKNGMAPFLPIFEEQSEEDKQFNQYRQKADPFPLWVDTKTGIVGYEILANDFTSEFDKLYEHFNLSPEGPHECIEVTKDQAVEMCRVLDYIQLGKYDKDMENIFFTDNEFFYVFENQFYDFGRRFRKNKPEPQNNQTVTVIVKHELPRVDGTGDSIACKEDVVAEENYADDCDHREEMGTVEYLRSVLSTFLMMEPRYQQRDEIEYKLVYYKWI